MECGGVAWDVSECGGWLVVKSLDNRAHSYCRLGLLLLKYILYNLFKTFVYVTMTFASRTTVKMGDLINHSPSWD